MKAGAEPSKRTAPNLCAQEWYSRVLGPHKDPRKKLAPRYSVESNEGAGDWQKNMILNYTTETGSKIVWSQNHAGGVILEAEKLDFFYKKERFFSLKPRCS